MLQVSAGVLVAVYGVIVFAAIAVAAILVVLLARPASRGLAIGVAPSTAALGVLPLVLIPTFLVPLAAVLHLVSLRGLMAAQETARAYS